MAEMTEVVTGVAAKLLRLARKQLAAGRDTAESAQIGDRCSPVRGSPRCKGGAQHVADGHESPNQRGGPKIKALRGRPSRGVAACFSGSHSLFVTVSILVAAASLAIPTPQRAIADSLWQQPSPPSEGSRTTIPDWRARAEDRAQMARSSEADRQPQQSPSPGVLWILVIGAVLMGAQIAQWCFDDLKTARGERRAAAEIPERWPWPHREVRGALTVELKWSGQRRAEMILATEEATAWLSLPPGALADVLDWLERISGNRLPAHLVIGCSFGRIAPDPDLAAELRECPTSLSAVAKPTLRLITLGLTPTRAGKAPGGRRISRCSLQPNQTFCSAFRSGAGNRSCSRASRLAT